jgi:hypothetical protein
MARNHKSTPQCTPADTGAPVSVEQISKLLPVMSQIDLQEKNLARQLEWISRHDSKASVVLGLATGMLGFLASTAPKPGAFSPLLLVFTSASIVPLVASFLFVHLGNYPRMRGPKSLAFFGTIAQLRFDEYKNAVLSRTPQTHLEDFLAQSHTVACIVARKFSALQWAYRMLFIALMPWAVCIFLYKAS